MQASPVLALLLTTLFLIFSCVPTGLSPDAIRRMDRGELEVQAHGLEQRRNERPRNVDVRIALGEVYLPPRPRRSRSPS